VRSDEALIGKRVRVRKVARPWPTPPASVGTIKKRWVDPSYTALDVLLDDGTQELEEISARA
jgi:hypothetical protein